MYYLLAIYSFLYKIHISGELFSLKNLWLFIRSFFTTKCSSVHAFLYMIRPPFVYSIGWTQSFRIPSLSYFVPSCFLMLPSSVLFSSAYKDAKHRDILKLFSCFRILPYLLHFHPTLPYSKILWANYSHCFLSLSPSIPFWTNTNRVYFQEICQNCSRRALKSNSPFFIIMFLNPFLAFGRHVDSSSLTFFCMDAGTVSFYLTANSLSLLYIFFEIQTYQCFVSKYMEIFFSDPNTPLP